MNQKQYKYIDLSGYSFTGKGAFNHLFSEFNGYHTHPYDFEFDIIRTQNGIVALYNDLVCDWSPVRSSEAIRAFKKNVQSYSGDGSFFSRLTTNGRQYDRFFEGFSKTSQKYIDSLIDGKWSGQWPYAFEKIPKLQIFLYKCLFYLGDKSIFESEVFLSAPSKEDFILKTKEYLNDVLTSNVSPNTSAIVMNNTFEPFNPSKSMLFFDNAKSIIIDRDPRDIYLSAWDYTNKDGSKGWRSTLGSDVDSFIKRFKLYRKNTNFEKNDAVLRLTFEDLVLEYDKTLTQIFNFLEEDKLIHINKKKYFDPEVSKRGVGMWKNTDRKKEIEYIYKNLKEYCKDY